MARPSEEFELRLTADIQEAMQEMASAAEDSEERKAAIAMLRRALRRQRDFVNSRIIPPYHSRFADGDGGSK